MAVPVVNPTPKQRAMSDPDFTKAHRSMLERSQFQASLDMAMLEYMRKLFQLDDPNNAYRMQGAHEFVRHLQLLCEAPERPPAPVDPRHLNYRA